VMLGHLGRERSADAVRDSLISTVKHLPQSLRATLTWDQGAEMAEHRAFSMATDMEVYFADPGAPWQRGSNENTVSVGGGSVGLLGQAGAGNSR
jgi:IS30 family transposase